MYAGGCSLAEIKSRTGINRRRLWRLIRRCIAIHEDGRVVGFRACRYYARFSRNFRKAPPPSQILRARHGYSGLLSQLFERHPLILEKLIERALGTGSKDVGPAITRMDRLHALFLSLCRDAGIKLNEYPFTVATQGESALARRLKIELARRNLRRVVSAMHGVEAAKRLANLDTPVRAGSAPRCYERVEFDAHRIDTLMNLTVDDLHSGELIWLLLERLWLLALIDSASGTVLGYHVAFGRNYSGEDVLICLENAILPWRPRELRIPGLPTSCRPTSSTSRKRHLNGRSRVTSWHM